MDHRQGFLVSAIVHLTLLTLLASGRQRELPADPDPEREVVQTSRVFLPPPEQLRQLAPAPAPPPRPAPPPPPDAKDRISIGAPSAVREKGPLVLRRDDDLTQVPKGSPDAAPTPAPVPVPESVRRAGGADEREGSDGLRLPAGRGSQVAGNDGSRGRPGEPGSLSSAVRDLSQRQSRPDSPGLPDGTGRQMGPLFFDSQGADFTRWINHFKNEVYRNWLVPQAAALGFGGEVKLRFTVDRTGRMSELTLLASSGTLSLDQAARGALLGSLLLPLPSDYAPPTATMNVTFMYGR